MIIKQCLVCKEKYSCKNYLRDRRKYCSHKCYHKATVGFIPWNKGLHYYKPESKTGWEITCKVCGKQKYYELNEHKKRPRYYCSPACYHLDSQKENLSYSGLHAWLRNKFGKAEICIYCESTKNIDWANKSHEYKKDIADWYQLCRKHHIAYDKGLLQILSN